MSTLRLPSALVDTDWLARHRDEPNLVLLDASFQPPVAGAPLLDDDLALRIPGARRFDFDQVIRDPDSDLPHMLPHAEDFSREVRKLGVSRDSLVVVYDRIGTYASPRAWWMLRAMGHDQVAVLDGGLPAWEAAGHPTERLRGWQGSAGDFQARPQAEWRQTADQVVRALNDEQYLVVDARSAERFYGHAPEPRPGLRSGHMPGAKNLPFDQVQTNGRMRPPEELKAAFMAAGPAA